MIDLLVVGGTVVTMDETRTILADGAVAIDGGRILETGPSPSLVEKYDAVEVINASGMAVMPGLIDTHGHAGHSLTKTLGERSSNRDWLDLMDTVYFLNTVPDDWLADGRLGALERLKFGTTCGVTVVGSQPRCDDPVYAGATAQGYQDLGIRGVICVGPARPPWPRTMATWTGTERVDHHVTFDQALRTTERVIHAWNGAGDGLIRVYVMPAVLMPSAETTDPAIDQEAMDREQADGVVDVATRYDTRIHTHCHSDMIRRAYHTAPSLLGPRLSLAHCTGINDEDIRILKETGAMVCHGPTTRSYIRARCPVPELIDAGVTVGLATDGTAPDRSFDLFAQFRMAMMLQRVHFADPGYMPPGKVLEMATIDAATALGLEAEIGSLETDKRADVILVNMRQPHLTPTNMVAHRLAYEANGQDVHTVIVDGRVLMRDRRVLGMDEETICADAERAAREVIERAGLQDLLGIPEGFWKSSKY